MGGNTKVVNIILIQDPDLISTTDKVSKKLYNGRMLEGHNAKYQECPLNIYTLCLGSLNNNTGPFPVTLQYKIISINIAGWLCIKLCGSVWRQYCYFTIICCILQILSFMLHMLVQISKAQLLDTLVD